MKTRTRLGVLIMAALIGSSVGVGYAGGGDSGGPGRIFLYQCYGVGGAPQQNAVLDINDQFTNNTTEQIGKLKLVCAPTDWDVHNPLVFQPTVVQGGDHFTCYELPGTQAQATTSVVTLTDAFGKQTVTVQGLSKYVCAVARAEPGAENPGGPRNIVLYQCYGVDGAPQQNAVLDINDQFTNNTIEQIGELKLGCAPTHWSVARPGFTPTVVQDGDHLTCYELPGTQAQATTSVVTLTDAFDGDGQTVTVQGPSKYVCAVARKECRSGCPVLDEP